MVKSSQQWLTLLLVCLVTLYSFSFRSGVWVRKKSKKNQYKRPWFQLTIIKSFPSRLTFQTNKVLFVRVANDQIVNASSYRLKGSSEPLYSAVNSGFLINRRAWRGRLAVVPFRKCWNVVVAPGPRYRHAVNRKSICTLILFLVKCACTHLHILMCICILNLHS